MREGRREGINWNGNCVVSVYFDLSSEVRDGEEVVLVEKDGGEFERDGGEEGIGRDGDWRGEDDFCFWGSVWLYRDYPFYVGMS